LIDNKTAMAPQKNVAIEDRELLERAAKVAEAEGKTVDELATEALQRELARRSFEKIKREAEARRGGMTDDEVDSTVERAITEYRQGR
jgi:hypothetical protein